jgi:hypothetical protein
MTWPETTLWIVFFLCGTASWLGFVWLMSK